MTDSRVTPQAAVEAAARAISIYPRVDEMDMQLARVALAAAVPLLCQPLQDEIDRAYAEIRKCIDELDEIAMQDDVTRFVMSEEDAVRWSLAYDRLSAFIDEVAPVGTGNPTED